MDDVDFNDFVEKANKCHDRFGTALSSGDADEMSELVSGLQTDEIPKCMNFLKEEEIISFEDA